MARPRKAPVLDGDYVVIGRDVWDAQGNRRGKGEKIALPADIAKSLIEAGLIK